MDTTVSVIVPAYNVEDYLPRCLDSLLAQTFRDFELILVDDGSSDTTGIICDRYGETDARVRVLHQANAGVSGRLRLRAGHLLPLWMPTIRQTRLTLSGCIPACRTPARILPR